MVDHGPISSVDIELEVVVAATCDTTLYQSSALLYKNSLRVKPTCFVIGKYSVELCVNRLSTSVLPRIIIKKKKQAAAGFVGGEPLSDHTSLM